MVEASVSNAFICPPWLTNIIFHEGISTMADILAAASEHLHPLIIHEAGGG